jgi:hypothetical protein
MHHSRNTHSSPRCHGQRPDKGPIRTDIDSGLVRPTPAHPYLYGMYSNIHLRYDT